MVWNDTLGGNLVGQYVHDLFLMLFFFFDWWSIDTCMNFIVEGFALRNTSIPVDFLIISIHVCEIYFVDEVAILFKDVESMVTLEKNFAIIEESWQINRFLKVIKKWIFAGVGLLIEFHLVMV